MKFIKINNTSSTPKYKQIIKCIELEIQSGKLKKGDKLPSINSIRDHFSLSRDTVLFAYSDLKTRGIVESIAGKGYYVKNLNINVTQKIFLLFDELNTFKENLYNSLIKNIGNNVVVDTYFHHFNYNAYSKLIYESIGNYNKYVIMPANLENAIGPIKRLPKDKVFILDQVTNDLKNHKGVYQNSEKGVFNRLLDIFAEIKKYNSLTLLFNNKQPVGIKNGFLKFCKISSMYHEIVDSFENTTPQKGDVFLVPDDRSLVEIIKKIRKARLRTGIDVGIIAINDSLLKEIIEGGITAITADFVKMGKLLADMITYNEKTQIEIPIELIKRNSL